MHSNDPGVVMDERRHILITGGAGYLGSALTAALLRRGHFVTVVDKLIHGGEHLLPFLFQNHFSFTKADVTQPGSLDTAVDRARKMGAPELNAVIHLAAIVGFPACKNVGDEEAWRQNVESVRIAFEQAESLGARRFIFSSTYSVYGIAPNGLPVTEESELYPQSLYGETKIAAEEILRSRAGDTSCAPLIFRLSTLYGPSPRMRFDLIVNQFVLEAYAKQELLIYQQSYSRSFVHILDVIDGFLIGLEAPEQRIRGEVFNLGGESGNFTKEKIVQLICEALPKTEVRYDDLSFSGDMRDVRVSFDKIREGLNYQTTREVKDGIEDVLKILRSGLLSDPFSDRFRNARLEIQ
jgi:nucleoside-diphosphate-sugar epimerase